MCNIYGKTLVFKPILRQSCFASARGGKGKMGEERFGREKAKRAGCPC
jgi:hypothetical protein